MPISDRKRIKIDHWLKHKTDANERSFYSIKRMDILTISISSACIYIVFEILRFLHSPQGVSIDYNEYLLKSSAVISVLAIILNFASQYTGNISNEKEAELASSKIQFLLDKKQGKENDGLSECLIKKADNYGSVTNFLNISSSILMGISIIFLVTFNLTTL